MTYSYHLSNKQSTSKNNHAQGTSSRFFGRVTRVILDGDPILETNPEYLYGVYYRLLDVDTQEQNTTTQTVALQGNPYIKHLPLEGELVVVELRVSENLNISQNRTVGYWVDVINIWNTPQHNALPDTSQPNWKQNVIKGIVESSILKPIKQFLGDIIIEGRFGQFLKLSGAGDRDVSVKGANSSPYVSIGIQGDTEIDDAVRAESLNTNKATILLTADHQIDLKEPVVQQKSFVETPQEVKIYQGTQGLFKTGRIILDADIDSVLVRGQKSIALNSKTVNLDAQDYVGINAKSIYIGGVDSSRDSEPALLGTTSEEWLQDLVGVFKALVQSCETASSVTGGPVLQLNAVAPTLKAQLQVLERDLSKLKSTKVYVS